MQPESSNDAAAVLKTLRRARELVHFRELVPYPGWHFDVDWDRPDPILLERRQIWEQFRGTSKIGPIEIEWHEGIRLTLYLGNDLSKQLFIAGSFEPNEFALLKRLLTPGMHFVDIGANEGLYTLFAARAVGETGRIYAFEPSPRELSRLRYNCRLNRFPQVQIFPLAVSDQNGFRTLSIAEGEHSGQNTFGALSERVQLIDAVEVPTRRLDDIAAAEGWDRLDVLKIDVEGEEIRLVQGASGILRAMRPLILFECSAESLERRGGSREQLLDLLRSLDNVIYRFAEATGLPEIAASGAYSENMIAAPAERPLPWSQ